MRTALLFLPSTLVVLLLVWHSLKTRGARETWTFFLFGLLFGVLRGNIIWWITTVHFGGRFPYVFTNRVFGFWHDSLQADIGWILTLYLGYTFAERILARVSGRERSLTHTLALAALFAVCLAWGVESTAIALGWWGWNLGTETRLLAIDVPMAGIAAWFSVPIDFLLSYLLWLRMTTRWRGRAWLSLTVFPLHMLVHLSNDRISALLPLTPFNLWYWITAIVVLIAPLAGAPSMQPSRAPGKPAVRSWIDVVPGVAIAIVLLVLAVADLFVARKPLLLVSLVPLAVFSLFALCPLPIGRAPVPVWRDAAPWSGLAILATAIRPLAFWPAALVAALCSAWTSESRWRASIRRTVVWLLPAVATVCFWLDARERDQVDRAYGQFIAKGTALAARGDAAGAFHEFDSAALLRPHNVRAFEEATRVALTTKDYARAERELLRLLELRPISPELMNSLGNVYLLQGDAVRARRAYEKALEFDPRYEPASTSLRRLDGVRPIR